ncbi:MAG: kinase/pyrophosphorylase [Chloroflexia bacterium]|nr:kinase/pyrophosphorylase [Chloroflexia bacterium]
MGVFGQHSILVVSDGTGETAERVTRAALLQFEGICPQIERRPEVRSKAQISEVIQEARQRSSMIVHTLVSSDLRRYLYMEANSYQVIAVDLMGGVLTEMSGYLEAAPQARPGILYGDESYFRRVDALEFTIHHDDGQRLHDVDKADIVLVGISRTSKTPVSIFLAYRGYRVANIPIVLDVPLPPVLDRVPIGRIVALIVDPRRLAAIRETRLQQYGGVRIEYADLEHIRRELRYSQSLFAVRNWPVVDATGKAVEETAWEVLGLVTDGLDHDLS